MTVGQKMHLSKCVFPDPGELRTRRALEKASHAQREQTVEVYTGLGRVVRVIGIGGCRDREFHANDMGYVHIPRHLVKEAVLMPEDWLR